MQQAFHYVRRNYLQCFKFGVSGWVCVVPGSFCPYYIYVLCRWIYRLEKSRAVCEYEKNLV